MHQNKTERNEEIIAIIEHCINNSSIYYNAGNDEWRPAIKLYSKTGRVFFISRDRMLDKHYVQIPEWDAHEDLPTLWEEINTNKRLNLLICESHGDQGEYCYSIFKTKRTEYDY